MQKAALIGVNKENLIASVSSTNRMDVLTESLIEFTNDGLRTGFADIEFVRQHAFEKLPDNAPVLWTGLESEDS